MTKIISLDQSVFWWINSHHNSTLDWILWCFSQSWSWLILLLTVFIFTTIRNDKKSWFWVLIGIGLCFLLADQISSNAIKDGVQRLRPCYELEGVRMFHTGKGGLYGFVSSHSANAFAIAMFYSLMYGRRCKKRRKENRELRTDGNWWNSIGNGYKSAVIPYIMFGWATIVGYSRPYLGKHYLGDVVCGALLGIGIGAAVYFVISRIRQRIASKSLA